MTETVTITDKLGRFLEVKRPSAADQLDLLEAAGNRAEYTQWFGMAALIFCCVSVDGVPLPTPRKPEDFKKNAGILQDAGLNAIAEYFLQQQQEKTAEEDLAAAKN